MHLLLLLSMGFIFHLMSCILCILLTSLFLSYFIKWVFMKGAIQIKFIIIIINITPTMNNALL